MKKAKIAIALLLGLVLCAGAYFYFAGEKAPDYARASNWAIRESGPSEKRADVFFIAPAVYSGKEAYNMSLDDEKTKAKFLGATNMERGIYDDDARFFAPYYRQLGLSAYELPELERLGYLSTAYADVKNAFQYYMAHDNGGMPIIVAGFSQGAELALRLVEDCFSDPAVRELLVACYAIGWRMTEDDVAAYPHLRPAAGERDTGVVVLFNSEAEEITDSLLIPAGVKTYAINPLSWTTDSTPAGKELNLGACFTNYAGEIEREIPALTGAYLDGTRGALKVTDVSPADYPGGISLFPDGVYHLYDYQFFYRNLEQNVQTRLDAYLESAASAESGEAVERGAAA